MTRLSSLLLAAFLSTGAAPLAPQTGLLVVAHGADSAWNAKVRETVAQVSWAHGPMALAFLMGGEAHTAGWDAAVDQLLRRGATHAVVVPLLVSSHGGHYHQIRYYAAELDTLPPELLRHHHAKHVPPPFPMRVTAALDAAPELSQVLVTRWTALAERDRRRPTVFIAHGPTDSTEAERWLTNLGTVTERLRHAGAQAPIRVQLLRDDAPPRVRAAAVSAMRDTVEALARRSGDSVLALPILISSGAISERKIPADLQGTAVRYVPAPLAPHPALSRWIERVAEEARTTTGAHPTR